jgi:hemin uptake protein HemP
MITNKPAHFVQNKAEEARGQDSVTKSSTASSAGLKRLRSAELFSGARELVIEHGGEEYRLRQTNQGKLILTK